MSTVVLRPRLGQKSDLMAPRTCAGDHIGRQFQSEVLGPIQ